MTDKKALKRKVHLIGYASGIGGVNPSCGEGPLWLQKSRAFNQLLASTSGFHWETMLKPQFSPGENARLEIRRLSEALAAQTAELTRQKEFFMVIGGDHTSAIGTWSGVYGALHQQGPLGLIWIDAHMDSHVPETSVSGRLHGMPLACLLGYGETQFTQLVSPLPKINPQHLCLIGIRSYEEGEAALLKKLQVKIYFMDEVRQRGFSAVLKEAIAHVKQGTAGYGLSVDVDSLDPQEAPGVDVPEKGGLTLKDLCAGLRQAAHDPQLIGAEVVEFDPRQDPEQLTEKAVVQLIEAITGLSHV